MINNIFAKLKSMRIDDPIAETYTLKKTNTRA